MYAQIRHVENGGRQRFEFVVVEVQHLHMTNEYGETVTPNRGLAG